MPRTRQTQSGDPAQKVRSTPGVRYGEGVELQQLQQNVPTPNARADTPAGTAVTPQQQGSPPVAGGSPLPPRPMPSPGLMRQPTMRPNEPLTAGLSRGAGPGPEAIGSPGVSPMGKFLRDLTDATGRSVFADMARRSGL